MSQKQVSSVYYVNDMEIEEFTKKIVTMRKELYSIASRMAGNGDMAEDMVQETMLKLWSIRHSLDRHTSHKALAITILRNKYNDYWRHRQLETGIRSGQTEAITEQASLEEKDEVELIKDIIGHLPPLQAQIFRMKEIEGYDKEEIMKITGCSPDSLRQNLSRARKRIREEFLRRVKGPGKEDIR